MKIKTCTTSSGKRYTLRNCEKKGNKRRRKKEKIEWTIYPSIIGVVSVGSEVSLASFSSSSFNGTFSSDGCTLPLPSNFSLMYVRNFKW